MNKRIATCIVLALLPVFTIAGPLAGSQPNVVLIFVDDMGYGDPSCYGGTLVPTPGIDRIAESGTRFTQGYVTAPVCGPSRYGLLTGAYQNRFGVYWNPHASRAIVPGTQVLLPNAFRDAGYTTCLIGKWNLQNDMHDSFDAVYYPMYWGGDYWPQEDGTYAGVGKGWGDSKRQGIWGPEHAGDEYLTELINDKAVEFIRDSKDEPFFLYLAYNAPHSPLHGRTKDKPEVAHIKEEPLQIYASMVLAVDEGISAILDTLNELELDKNTIVLFASDNGPAKGGFKNYKKEWPRVPLGSTDGLRSLKGNYYEGGIRIPMMIQWPGTFKSGQVCPDVTTTLDFYPTLLEAAGIKKQATTQLDGMSLLPVLTGKKPMGTKRGPLYWRSDKWGCMRDGDWKLIVWNGDKRAPELYNLARDREETNDLSKAHPEKTKQMQEQFENWLSTMPPPVSLEKYGKPL